MIFNGDLRAKQAKADEILAIYNSGDSFGAESFNIKHPEKCVIVEMVGIKGGVICELFSDNAFGIIFFAGVEKEHRKCGHLRRMVDELKQYIKVIGVQVNPTDQREVWQALGFDKFEAFINMCPTLMCISNDEYEKLMADTGNTINKDGIPVDQLMKYFQDHDG